MHRELVILGAGPAGLSCAASSTAGSVLIDAAGQVGGLAQVVDDFSGFSFQPVLPVLLPEDADGTEPGPVWAAGSASVYQGAEHAACRFTIASDGLPRDSDEEGIAGALLEKIGLAPGRSLAAEPGGWRPRISTTHGRRDLRFASFRREVARIRQAADGLEAWTLAPLGSLGVEQHTLQADGYPPVRFERLVSTIPLTELVRRTAGVPAPIRDAASLLRACNSMVVGIGAARHCTDHHWIYYPDPEVVFFRVTAATNLEAGLAPPGSTLLNVELASPADRPIPRAGIIRRVLTDLIQVQLLRPTDRILHMSVFEAPSAYPLDDAATRRAVAEIRRWYREHGVLTAGRGGTWRRLGIQGAIASGRQAAAEAFPNAPRRSRPDFTPFATA